MDYRYFKPDEFSRCNPPCDISQMDEAFMLRLDEARFLAGVPFVLNCAFRSKEHELKQGRSGSSFHTLGRAVDIRCTNPQTRSKILEGLFKANFSGIGVSKTFIHVDDRPYMSQTCWLY